MQHYHQMNCLKKLKFVSFQKWGTPPAVKSSGGNFKLFQTQLVHLQQDWPSNGGTNQFWLRKGYCLSVTLSVCLSVCLSALISAISHQQANMQCHLGAPTYSQASNIQGPPADATNISLKCRSPNLPYSEGIGSQAVAIPLLKVVQREKLCRGKLQCTAGATFKSPKTVHILQRHS